MSTSTKGPATNSANKNEFTHDLNAIQKFSTFIHPMPVDKEVSWDKSLMIVSKTDAYGVIEYVNDVFIDVSGYEEHELMGMPHSIVRHPDMPKVLFKVLWDHLTAGKVIHPIVKNLAKSGRYYWVMADFEIKRNDKGEIAHYYSRRRSVAPEVIRKVEVLYDKLLQIEAVAGMGQSEKYLIGFLEDMGKTYDEFIEDLIMQYAPDTKAAKVTATTQVAPPTPEPEVKKGFFGRLFGK